ncbi:MAG: tRNA (adenosine(37)-N6)-dimethylallyltransferase MiaA [Candidatus Hydrogenedentes bacterium]|nr:tRNA (adenosine(37)-N6)-dimethylallyltransferase MiaA [Candidatus Hydrogenedentota bacterium]
MKNVIAVVGPTASGKTALALELARRLDSEIISADSMQVYRGMEIGTAAPTPGELARAKHHFVGILEPGEEFSAGRFERMARPAVDALNARGRIAVVAGGAGLYVRALIEGLFPGPAKDDSIRTRLHREAEEAGVPALYARLQLHDPAYAQVINPNDLRRIVRALEVYELTGEPLSKLHAKHKEAAMPLDAVQAAFDWPREQLYARIDARVDRMIEQGFVEEVQRLLDAGYARHLHRLRSLGYREIAAFLAGQKTLEEAVDAMKQNTRRFAKRQLTWFRADPGIHWLNAGPERTVESYADEVLGLL